MSIKYLRNTFWILSERILRLGINFATNVYLIRSLLPEQFGLLSYALNFVALLTVLATLDIESVLIKELVNHPEQHEDLLSAALGLRLYSACLAFLILVIVAYWIASPQEIELIEIIAFGYFFLAANVVETYFQALVQARSMIPAQFIQMIVSAVFKVILIFCEAPLSYLAGAFFVEIGVLTTGLWIIYFNKFKYFNFNFQWKIAKVLLKKTYPMLISGLLIAVYMKIDQLLLKHLLNEEVVGYYAAAVRLVEATYFLPMSITSSLFPAIIQAKTKHNRLYYIRLRQIYSLVVWLAILISTFISFFSERIVAILYGESYGETSEILAWYVWVSVFVFFGVARSKWVVIENQQIYTIIYIASGALSNLIANIVFIPIQGAMGAVFASLISSFIATLLVPFILNAMHREQVCLFFTALLYPIRYLINVANDRY